MFVKIEPHTVVTSCRLIFEKNTANALAYCIKKRYITFISDAKLFIYPIKKLYLFNFLKAPFSFKPFKVELFTATWAFKSLRCFPGFNYPGAYIIKILRKFTVVSSYYRVKIWRLTTVLLSIVLSGANVIKICHGMFF